MGRYSSYRMHPFPVAEIAAQDLPDPTRIVRPPRAVANADWDALWRHGGYPEPWLKRDRRFDRRWQALRFDQLVWPGMKGSRLEWQLRVQLETPRVLEPLGVIEEGRALAAPAISQPELSDWPAETAVVEVDQDVAIHRERHSLEELLLETDSLRQAVRLKVKPHDILARVCEIPDAAFETQYEQHSGVVSECHTGISPLNPVQGRPAHLGAFGHERHRDAASTPSIA